MKRYIRLDIEYDSDKDGYIQHSLTVMIQKNMPYCKVMGSLDCPTKQGLDRERYRPPPESMGR